MDKQQAQENIRDTFENSFDKGKFTNFIKNLLNRIEEDSFSYQGQFIPDSYKPFIRKYTRIGKFSDGENRIDILIVYLSKDTSIERARSSQRNFIAGYLQGKYGSTNEKEAALVAFVSPDEADWRFSLVKMDYKFEQTKTGKMKVKEEFTPARRWSFLVGENEKSHTAQSRLVNILANDEQAPTLEEIEKAFDIETVTKEFFLKYRQLFLCTKEELDRVIGNDPKIKADFDDKGVDTVNFAKKLLGQIIFLYFLQKKGWFGVGRDDNWGTGSKHFLRELFEKKHGDYKNFFNDVLEPLFYEALRSGKDREHIDYYYSRFDCKIPFLNGGLFDPIGNYDWVHTDIIIPDELFSNKVKTREGDTGNGILDIFDRYNFTVKEDEPLEKEVAIDPELLGKAYEKFNAIRPDNFTEFKKALKSGKKGEENKFNKKFGVYYTPREIVHYMCQQSLINYLFSELNKGPVSYEKLGDPQLNMFGNKGKKGQLDLTIEHKSTPSINKEDIEILIHIGENISENEETALIKEQNIKEGKQKTSDYKLKLSESIRKNAALIDQKLADITVCDPAVGSGAFPVGMMSEIVRARNVLSVFLDDNSRTAYEFKRRCIEHSLYGVDIDPGAVEMAKLRLWLSLVVDEDDIKNIKPLPNLDYRIMQGNSLISEFMGINFETDKEKNIKNLGFKDEVDELIDNFQQRKDKFLNESNVTRKTKLKEKVDDLLIKIFETELKIQKEGFFKRLKEIENKNSKWPKEEQRQKYTREDKEQLYKESGFDLESAEKQLKEFTSGRKIKPFFLWNLYFSEVFHDKGGFDVVIANPPYKVLTTNNTSIIEYRYYNKNYKAIVGSYSKNLFTLFIEHSIKLLKAKANLCYIIPEGLFKTRSYKGCVDLMEKEGHTKLVVTFTDYVFKNAVTGNLIFLFQRGWKGKTSYFHFNSEYELSKIEVKINKIIGKIENDSVPLTEIATMFKGMVVKDRDTVLTKEKKNNKNEFLLGKNISKWMIISKYYTNYDKLQIIGGTKKLTKHNQVPRILIRRTGDTLCCAYLEKPALTESTLYSCWSNSQEFPNKFLLSLFNSKVLNYYNNKLFITNQQGFPQILMTDLGQLPIKRIPIREQKPFINLVDRILSITKDEDYFQNPQKQTKVKTLEAKIDQMVYKLYGLTESEIAIVEAAGK